MCGFELATSFLILPFAFLLLANNATSVLNGDLVEWSKYGHVVKVIARNNAGFVQACSGSRISPTLLVTSPDCVLIRGSDEQLTEFAITTTMPDSQRRRFNASILEINREKSWAIMRISGTQNITELCPADPAPKMITRLDLEPKLIGEPPAIILGQSCFLVGFESTEDSKCFTQEATSRLDLGTLMGPYPQDNNYLITVWDNSTPCYEDVGAALICSTKSHKFVQVGIFRALYVRQKGRMYNDNTTELCEKASKMQFSLLTTDYSLAQALKKYALKEIRDTYQACGFKT